MGPHDSLPIWQPSLPSAKPETVGISIVAMRVCATGWTLVLVVTVTGLVFAIVVLLAVAALLALPVLTAFGAHRRGLGPLGSVVAGVFFPVTWAVWYLHDEDPYRRTAPRA